MEIPKNYKFENDIEGFKKEVFRLSGFIGELTVIFVGLDEKRQEQLMKIAWSLMRQWRKEQEKNDDNEPCIGKPGSDGHFRQF